MRRYVGLIHRARDGAYGISFPDFPGCISAGRTVEEAIEQGSRALRFHAEGMIEDGMEIGDPTAIEALRGDREFADDFADAMIVLVPMLPPRERPMRLNVSLDQALVTAIDHAAEQIGMSRSGLLAEAARRMLAEESFDDRLRNAADEAVAAGGRALDGIRRVIDDERKRSLREDPLPDLGKFSRHGRKQ